MLLLIQYVTRFPACVVTGHGPAADGPEAVEAADGPEDAVDAVDVLQVPPGGRAGRDHEAELPPVPRRHQCPVNTKLTYSPAQPDHADYGAHTGGDGPYGPYENPEHPANEHPASAYGPMNPAPPRGEPLTGTKTGTL